MSEIEARLQKLEDRFLDGEISEDTFKELRGRLLARKNTASQGGGRSDDSVSVTDSVVKGDIHRTSQAAGGATVGGGINFHMGPNDTGSAELQYEDFVTALLESGGRLDSSRRLLDMRRRELRLSLVSARSIEEICEEAVEGSRGEAAEQRATEEAARRREAADQKERERLAREGPAPGTEKTIELPGGVPLVLCWCPATTSESWKRISGGEDYFWMGSPEEELGRFGDEVRHRVRLTHGFWLGKYPVTQRQWGAVWGSNPSSFEESGPEAPVEQLSWEDAQEWLVKANGALGWKVELRLPTEAEWEYGCRAGTTSTLNNGKELTSEDGKCPHLGQVGWYDENSGGKTHPVGQLRPNAWGLHDCHGNVWEWCADGEASYEGCDTVTDDPEGPPSGSSRVNRGGCWYFSAQDCRSAYRYRNSPGFRDYGLGFRLALSSQFSG